MEKETRAGAAVTASGEWMPSAAVSSALHPSTSKEFVLPRTDRTIFPILRYPIEEGNVVLKRFYELEKCYQPSSKYFECVQSQVTVEMRTILVQWMLEVCEEERCSCEIFPLAVSYLDRFLSVQVVHKNQLQALGVGCLFLASKVKETHPIASTRLVQYTDESVSVSEVLSWELLILNRLNWDLATPTAFDFLDQYLHCWWEPKDVSKWRPVLNCMVAQAATDFSWAVRLPSEIAKHLCLCLMEQQSQVQ